jgi:hypothetical protein
MFEFRPIKGGFRTGNVVVEVITHNDRVLCSKQFGALVSRRTDERPHIVITLDGVRDIYREYGLTAALKSLRTLGEFPKEIHGFALACMDQTHAILLDEKRSCYRRMGYDIWWTDYECTYTYLSDVTTIMADAIASASAAVAVYSGYHMDTVNESYSSNRTSTRDTSPFEIANAVHAVIKIIEQQKNEFDLMIDSIRFSESNTDSANTFTLR